MLLTPACRPYELLRRSKCMTGRSFSTQFIAQCCAIIQLLLDTSMKRTTILAVAFSAVFCCGFYLSSVLAKQASPSEGRTGSSEGTANEAKPMSLGAFSMSLNVKDVVVSKEFYEKLGFVKFGGDVKHKYVIMKNGNALIGLFQGMIKNNTLTFNPGWDENAKNVDNFVDVRDIQRHLLANKITLDLTADEKTKGPAYIVLRDPDGNEVLLDQHR